MQADSAGVVSRHTNTVQGIHRTHHEFVREGRPGFLLDFDPENAFERETEDQREDEEGDHPVHPEPQQIHF